MLWIAVLQMCQRVLKPVYVALLLAAGSVALCAQTAVGTIPATFQVSNAGNASYILPVNIPGGIAGLAPNISLVYDSPSGADGENRGDIRFNDGVVLLRAASRVADTSGNFFDIFYKSSNAGNYNVSRVAYTGHQHDVDGSQVERAPFAEVDFTYENG